MGMCTFEDFVLGTTAQEAFRQVDAQILTGHREFMMILDFQPSGDLLLDRVTAMQLADQLITDKDPRIADPRGPVGCIEIGQILEGSKLFYFFGWFIEEEYEF